MFLMFKADPVHAFHDQIVAAHGATMIRQATNHDFSAILALNEELVHFLSPMDEARLRHLDAQAAYHRVVEIEGTVVAFLLGLREGADYDSPNYIWFASALDRFLYIDRVVVSPAYQGKGYGPQLYDDLFAVARKTGVKNVTSEFDVEPPNPASLKLHQRYGFKEIGTQTVSNGMKRVSLQMAEAF